MGAASIRHFPAPSSISEGEVWQSSGIPAARTLTHTCDWAAVWRPEPLRPSNRSCEHDIFSPAGAIANFAAHHMIVIMQK
jgi:hypothetical protein